MGIRKIRESRRVKGGSSIRLDFLLITRPDVRIPPGGLYESFVRSIYSCPLGLEKLPPDSTLDPAGKGVPVCFIIAGSESRSFRPPSNLIDDGVQSLLNRLGPSIDVRVQSTWPKIWRGTFVAPEVSQYLRP